MTARFIVLAVLAFSVGCASKLVGQCDHDHACDGGLACVSGGVCAQNCSALVDGGCPPGMTCQTAGLFCEPGEACPALALDVCLLPDGGT